MERNKNLFSKFDIFLLNRVFSKNIRFNKRLTRRVNKINILLENLEIVPVGLYDVSLKSWQPMIEAMTITYKIGNLEKVEEGFSLLDKILESGDYPLYVDDVWRFVNRTHPTYMKWYIETIQARYPYLDLE